MKDLKTYEQFQAKASTIRQANLSIWEDDRYPSEVEVKQIGAYCTGLLQEANKIMDETEDLMLSPRRLT